METQLIPKLSDMRNYVESNIATDGILSDKEQDLLDGYLRDADEYYCTLRLLKLSLPSDSERYETCAKGMDEADDLQYFIQAIIDRSNQLKEEKKNEEE